MSRHGPEARVLSSRQEVAHSGCGDAASATCRCHGVAQLGNPVDRCALPATEAHQRPIVVKDQVEAPGIRGLSSRGDSKGPGHLIEDAPAFFDRDAEPREKTPSLSRSACAHGGRTGSTLTTN